MPAKRLLMLVAALALGACATLMPPGDARPPHPLVLVSIDAFRADYLQRGLTPNLRALADGGAEAPMRPSFPSLTFPNHYTLVTGKRPDHNGVVANLMYDPTHPADPNDPRAAYFDKTKSGDGFWWNQARPMWVSAEQAGLKTGIVFWPGSTAEIDHTRASYVMPFTKGAQPGDEVDQLLRWMDLPAAQRPQVYILYMDPVDQEGHHHGPDSPELDAALGQVDSAIGQLRRGLKQRGIDADIVVVSDHGMIAVSPQRVTYISDALGGLAPDARTDPRYDMIYWGSVAMLNAAPGHAAELDRLTRMHFDHMSCWHKRDIPAHYRFGRNPRVPGIVCLAEPGWQVGGIAGVGIGSDVGNHGYDPATPEMRAIFIANGPDILPGTKLGLFDNVDVYDFEMALLHLRPDPNDGTLTPLRAALVP